MSESKAENLSLNGNVSVSLCLAKDEIARLSRIALAEYSSSDVVDAISRGTPLKSWT